MKNPRNLASPRRTVHMLVHVPFGGRTHGLGGTPRQEVATMHTRLQELWIGRRAVISGANEGLAQWTRTLLEALGAQAEILEAPEGSNGLSAPSQADAWGGWAGEVAPAWSIGALREALKRCRAEVWICADPPPAHTPAELREALALLSDSLTAARDAGCRCALLMLGDGAYRNLDTPWSCHETDPLGGQDAAGCAESCLRLLAEGFRQGFWGEALPTVVAHHGALCCGGMASNLPPNLSLGNPAQTWLTMLARGRTLFMEHPDQLQPFQHALEPVAGALLAAGRALTLPLHCGDTWNFGASAQNWCSPRTACRTLAETLRVQPLIEEARTQPSGQEPQDPTAAPLSRAKAQRRTPQPPLHPPRLESEKARQQLGWRTVYDAEDTLRMLAAWQADAQARGERAASAAQAEAFLRECMRPRD